MSLVSALYNGLAKRTSTFMVTIMVGAFVYERAVDTLADRIYEGHNKGKLWQDIKHKYENPDN
eukprot:snap_masked-scaffold176_size284796-processed-gene-0.4 protein:Tk06850 transcript:snap_masked-scaffold176_size284796-processed-gene-0.4-mRNA-1 annotation:"cytochrome b-c1 complex subunit 9"